MKALDLTFKDENQIIKLLKNGKIGALPTDTIYGLVGSALNPKTIEEIYSLRKRDTAKPMIILISSLDDLKKFNIILTKEQTKFLKKVWPNPVSVILPCPLEKFIYLHRDKKSLAFRLPKDKNLLKILKEVGPLVAPSANFEKRKPAETITEAKKYFEGKVAFYVDEGKLKSKPSTVIRLYEDGTQIVLREGSFRGS
ncbi:threonylcarbamoyl-AMP synthase [Candidatus Daviesbacteria bacterium]|nr:threonylcarbamoyl-AMP synthase [Candidatus Daviesbacteria bacterium]